MRLLPDAGSLSMSSKTGIAHGNLKFLQEGRICPESGNPRFLAFSSPLP